MYRANAYHPLGPQEEEGKLPFRVFSSKRRHSSSSGNCAFGVFSSKGRTNSSSFSGCEEGTVSVFFQQKKKQQLLFQGVKKDRGVRRTTVTVSIFPSKEKNKDNCPSSVFSEGMKKDSYPTYPMRRFFQQKEDIVVARATVLLPFFPAKRRHSSSCRTPHVCHKIPLLPPWLYLTI